MHVVTELLQVTNPNLKLSRALRGTASRYDVNEKNPFPTLIFLIDTFAKQFVDSLVIAVHTNLLAAE